MELEDILAMIKAVSNKLDETAEKIDYIYNLKCNENAQNINDTQDALCETSVEINEHLADIEDALCELSEEEEKSNG